MSNCKDIANHDHGEPYVVRNRENWKPVNLFSNFGISNNMKLRNLFLLGWGFTFSRTEVLGNVVKANKSMILYFGMFVNHPSINPKITVTSGSVCMLPKEKNKRYYKSWWLLTLLSTNIANPDSHLRSSSSFKMESINLFQMFFMII